MQSAVNGWENIPSGVRVSLPSDPRVVTKWVGNISTVDYLFWEWKVVGSNPASPRSNQGYDSPEVCGINI